MKFTGDISVPAPRDAVYAKVRDARFFASCVEGVQDLNEIDAGSCRGADRGDERIVASLAEAPPIGDHADNRAHGRGSVPSTLLRRPVSA